MPRQVVIVSVKIGHGKSSTKYEGQSTKQEAEPEKNQERQV
jgi:hypothetical protein